MAPAHDSLYLDGKPGRTAMVNGKEFLFCSGYNYLGVNNDPDFIGLIAEGISRYGWLYPSSRISNTRLHLYEECEALLSACLGTQDTVLLPSGFAAGRVAIAHHAGSVYNSPQSHPAILQQKSNFSDMDEWQRWLLQKGQYNGTASAPLVVASDSVNPLTATIHDFSFFAQVQNPVMAILDDSHGVGLLGDDGFGLSAGLPYNEQMAYVFTYSLSKALGINGGAISCSKEQVARFKLLPEYTGATPVSPAQVYAFVKGQHIYARQRQKLRQNIRYFELVTQHLPGIKHTLQLPVFILPTAVDETVFYNNGVLISSFPYPDPAGQKLKRIVLNALHTPDDMDRIANVLQQAYR